MICPACRNEEMIVVEWRKIELDICVTCRGVWFDADELRLLLDQLQLRTEEIGRPPAEKTAEAARKCPHCRRKMLKVLVGPGVGVMIDRCRNGHGLWFDGGELDTVIGNLSATGHSGQDDSSKTGKVGSFLKDVLLSGDNEAT
jgi:uncharacterized protein